MGELAIGAKTASSRCVIEATRTKPSTASSIASTSIVVVNAIQDVLHGAYLVGRELIPLGSRKETVIAVGKYQDSILMTGLTRRLRMRHDFELVQTSQRQRDLVLIKIKGEDDAG